MIWKCNSCAKWKFFEKKVDGICSSCDSLRKNSEYYFLMEKRKEEKALRRELREKELNERLKSELKAPVVKKEKVRKTVIKEKVVTVKRPRIKIISLLQEAEKLSDSFDSVLYVYADVKRVKVIEWINGKKRVALNKSREVRHTHKGGFSQEKFQRFVDSKKKNWLEWVGDNLSRDGVLRGPYDHVVVEGVDEEWIRSFL